MSNWYRIAGTHALTEPSGKKFYVHHMEKCRKCGKPTRGDELTYDENYYCSDCGGRKVNTPKIEPVYNGTPMYWEDLQNNWDRFSHSNVKASWYNKTQKLAEETDNTVYAQTQRRTRPVSPQILYNIYKVTNDRADEIVTSKGIPIEIRAKSPRQAILFAKHNYPYLQEYDNEYAGRTLRAKPNTEKMQQNEEKKKEKAEEMRKYREIMQELKRKKEERAQEIYDK